MAIYKLESAIDDTIQTPDDVGNDLDQIEKDIAGPDGIEAHEEEIEDAVSGMIDDAEIAESVNMMIFESEYNLNQIFECLEINMLEAATTGSEEDLSDTNKKGFVETAVNAIKTAFASFGKIIWNIIQKIVGLVGSNKKFIKEHRNAITDGFNKLMSSDKEFKGIKYNTDIINDIAKKATTDQTSEISSHLANNMRPEDFKKKFGNLIVGSSSSDVQSVKDISKYIATNATDPEEKSMKDIYGSAENLIKVLELDTASKIRSDYNEVKKNIDTQIKNLKKDKTNDNANKTKVHIRLISDYQVLMQAAVADISRIRTKELSQARRFASRCVTAAGIKKTFEGVKESSTVSSNSFDNLAFI